MKQRTTKRKSAPEVKNGRVRKKNNWEITPHYSEHEMPYLVFDRQRPGAGYRHVLKQGDLERFIALLPNWQEISQGLNGILLAPGSSTTFGYHRPGMVAICAWPISGIINYHDNYFEHDRALIERLSVPYDEVVPGSHECQFTTTTARAHQLLATFLHELGHHHDAITNKSKRIARGEPYAYAYEEKFRDIIWERYTRVFEI